MRPRYKVSRAGLELVKSFEGLRRKAARLPDGRWTIGYGHTLSAREGAEVSPADAEALLQFDLLSVVEAVNNLVFTPINQNQFDALAAFAFNVGVEEFRHSDVLKRVNEGRLTEAACALDLWRRADVAGDHIVLDALIRRRAAEKAVFLTPVEGFVPTPSALVRPAVDPDAAHLLPKVRPVEIEAPLEGEHAQIRRLGPIEPALPAETHAPALAAAAVASAPVLEAFAPPAEPEAAVPPAPEPEPEPVAEAPVAPAPEPETVAPYHVEPANDVPLSPLEAAQQAEPGAEVLQGEALPAEAYETEAFDANVEPAGAPVQVPEPEVLPAWTAAPSDRPEPTRAEPAAALGEAPEAEDAAVPEAAPEIAPEPEPEPTFAPEPELSPAPAGPRSVAEAVMSSRLYASYGPMAIPAMPPRASLATVDGEPVTAEAAVALEPQVPAEPISTFGPPFVPQAAALAEIAAEPAVTAVTQPVAAPLVLTPPPEEGPQAWQPAATTAPVTAIASETDSDEFTTPLFDDGWDAAEALGGRIVHHETPEAEDEEGRRPADGPYIILGAIGLAAFVGAVGAFLKARAGEGHGAGPFDNTALLAWVLAILGAACVGTSIYFLLRRLGGAED